MSEVSTSSPWPTARIQKTAIMQCGEQIVGSNESVPVKEIIAHRSACDICRTAGYMLEICVFGTNGEPLYTFKNIPYRAH